MRIIFLLSIIITSHFTGYAQMDIPPVGFNPRATISEDVGITSITIKYSRPGVKGREGKIWGSLVQYGFGNFSFVTGGMTSPWRAGANEATVISFEHDVKVEGRDLKAGTYALFMAMSADSALLIFSNLKDAWGSFYYNQSHDVLRVGVKTATLDKSVEWLKYEFIEHKERSCVVALQWEKLSIPFKVDVDVDNIVLARMRAEFTGVKGFVSANKLQASMYWFDRNTNMEEALVWAQSAVTGRPFSQSSYDAFDNLAKGYEKLNRISQADSVMDEGLSIANFSQYTGYGRRLWSKKRYDRALEIMLGAQRKFVNTISAQQKAKLSEDIEKLKLKKDIN
jgi:hypothetical protein